MLAVLHPKTFPEVLSQTYTDTEKQHPYLVLVEYQGTTTDHQDLCHLVLCHDFLLDQFQ